MGQIKKELSELSKRDPELDGDVFVHLIDIGQLC
jgi:hypothetical protein